MNWIYTVAGLGALCCFLHGSGSHFPVATISWGGTEIQWQPSFSILCTVNDCTCLLSTNMWTPKEVCSQGRWLLTVKVPFTVSLQTWVDPIQPIVILVQYVKSNYQSGIFSFVFCYYFFNNKTVRHFIFT